MRSGYGNAQRLIDFFIAYRLDAAAVGAGFAVGVDSTPNAAAPPAAAKAALTIARRENNICSGSLGDVINSPGQELCSDAIIVAQRADRVQLRQAVIFSPRPRAICDPSRKTHPGSNPPTASYSARACRVAATSCTRSICTP